ncbi:polysaccharide deacetylase family protein [Streptomyces sp. NPDC000410]|uniref:polysaccharide deacetylase family protein n=1 Tax=Streptomyces sp. NPDC000410 TaxID=3154254 RepID=UPI00331ACD3A
MGTRLKGHRQGRAFRKGLLAILGTGLLVAPLTAAHPAERAVARTQAAPKIVYLTFDDGPSTKYTAQVQAVLTRYKVRATFFQTGHNVAVYPSITRRTHLLGHSVQNHTWSHVDLTTVTWKRFQDEVNRTDAAIRAQTGYKPRCLRPPYGASDSLVRQRADLMGKKLRFWTVDPRDWSRPGARAIESRVLANVRSGSVILLHDGGGDRSQTVAALPKILSTLKARGYTFSRMTCG